MSDRKYAPRRGRVRAVTLTLLMAGLAAAAGCSKAKPTAPADLAPSPRLLPADVVNALQWAYTHRDPAVYGRLLADDFHFWFDPATRPAEVPEFWTQRQDSTGTANLFGAGDVSDIRITLTFGSDTPAPGHERWRKIRVTDTFLEVDKVPPSGEVLTFRIDGDVQEFYIRKGRTPADTLASSATAQEWFLVEWHDLARNAVDAAAPARTAGAAAGQATTWGAIKALYGR